MRTKSLIILIVLLLSASCKTSKKVADTDDFVSTLSLNDRYNYLVEGYSEWNNLYMPVKVKLIAPKKMSLSARVTMNRDKNILFSLRFLGMEVGNIYVTEDSIFAVDKLHNYYLAESIDGVFKDYDVAMSDIQNLLLGQVFMQGQGTLKKNMRKKIEVSEVDNDWFITPKKQPQDINYFFTLDKDDNNLSKLSIKHVSFPQVECRYGKFEKSVIGLVAGSTTISGQLGSTPIEVTIEWNQRQCEWNFSKERKWIQPKGYVRISAEQLLKAFSSEVK